MAQDLSFQIRDLTIGILTRGNEETLSAAIKSVYGLGHVLLLGPIKDDSILAEYPNISWTEYPWENSFSLARSKLHQLCQTSWILHLDSDESLDPTAIPLIKERLKEEPRIWRVSIFLNDARILAPRLMPKDSSWNRPVHEIPKNINGIWDESRIHIRHENVGPQVEAQRMWWKYQILEKEFNRTRDPDLLCLSAMDVSFFNLSKACELAKQYLADFGGSNSKKVKAQLAMMEYLVVYSHGRGGISPETSINSARRLIVRYPEYAEFWCLLGDLYLMRGAPFQAKEMFENALGIGEHVPYLSEDRIWVDMEKYGNYPRVRIKQCLEALEPHANS